MMQVTLTKKLPCFTYLFFSLKIHNNLKPCNYFKVQSGPYTKTNCMSQKLTFAKFKVLISNMTIVS